VKTKDSIRLDQYLVNEGFAETRNKAVWMIEQGWVKVNGKVCIQKSFGVDLKDVIDLNPSKRIYVSQGGYKLEKAITEFDIDLKDKNILDVGASTGGFTDCALQHGARSVTAIDIGEGQIHASLKQHPQVYSLEKVDIRNIEPKDLNVSSFDYILVDVSFISLEFVFPSLQKFLVSGGKIIALLKPQFEQVERRKYKNGIIKNEKVRLGAIEKVQQHILANGFEVEKMTHTDADGKEKNIEYLLLLRPAQHK
jgi:23S rRNA (cytidine1920-2'-O)/16S rRNA (cytidine1409-2'-O)-methyltransferase